jgi:hypothetical protein
MLPAMKVNGDVDAATQSSKSDSSLTTLFSLVDMKALFHIGLVNRNDICDSDLFQSDYATVAALLNGLATALVAGCSHSEEALPDVRLRRGQLNTHATCDCLIRYANAAKSKSTWIVSQQADRLLH